MEIPFGLQQFNLTRKKVENNCVLWYNLLYLYIGDEAAVSVCVGWRMQTIP